MTRRPPADYSSLEDYLNTVFALLEGLADSEEAHTLVRSFLERSKRYNNLSLHYEEFLIRLFFDKCSKEFQSGARDRG